MAQWEFFEFFLRVVGDKSVNHLDPDHQQTLIYAGPLTLAGSNLDRIQTQSKRIRGRRRRGWTYSQAWLGYSSGSIGSGRQTNKSSLSRFKSNPFSSSPEPPVPKVTQRPGKRRGVWCFYVEKRVNVITIKLNKTISWVETCQESICYSDGEWHSYNNPSKGLLSH